MAARLSGDGDAGIHGFAIARRIQEEGDERRLTATGTLYRALHRLEEFGHLTSDWEDPAIALAEGRPVRKLYWVTAPGERALALANSSAAGQRLVIRTEVPQPS